MIDSIVELPEFSQGSRRIEISGERFCNLYSGIGVFNPSDILDLRTAGRHLMIPKGYFKYKLKLTDYQANRIYTIVGVTPKKVDLSVPKPDKEHLIDFFPLYVREYTRSGTVHGNKSNLYLWLPGINNFFSSIMQTDVTSLATAFKYIISKGMVQEFEPIPYEIKDNYLDDRFATLAPIPENTMYTMIDPGSYSANSILKQAVDQCCVLEGNFTDRLLYCLSVRRFGQLNCLIDPLHRDDPISACVAKAADNDWGCYYQWIHNNEDYIDKYFNCDNHESIAQLLYLTSLIPTPDFNIECTPASERSQSVKGFNPFTLDNINGMDINFVLNRVSEHVHTLFSSNYFEDTRRFKLSGSYLEELCIYDVNGELIGYIDQVWWILATGYGLLNSRNVFI